MEVGAGTRKLRAVAGTGAAVPAGVGTEAATVCAGRVAKISRIFETYERPKHKTRFTHTTGQCSTTIIAAVVSHPFRGLFVGASIDQ